MKTRRTFLKAFISTLSGAAALPFVKLQKNKMGRETKDLGDGRYTYPVFPDEARHIHNVGTYDDAALSAHSHSVDVPENIGSRFLRENGSPIPPGTVIAFIGECPPGWRELNPSRFNNESGYVLSKLCIKE